MGLLGHRSARRTWAGLGTAALLLLVGACGDDDAEETATTTEAPDEGDDETPSTSRATSTTRERATTSRPAGGDDEDVWAENATQHRGEDGERFTIDCPAGGTEYAIWGVETYTDDSSICTAAVHVGLITLEDGGEVEYEIAPGLTEYEAASANGILSNRYASYEGSFFFPDAPPGSGDFVMGDETWARNATEYRGDDGRRVTILCAPDGPLGAVWGTETYTDDSSICTAAVHAGLITPESGGAVNIRIGPGQESYRGSTANGVTSSDYGPFDGSFTFPDEQPSR